MPSPNTGGSQTQLLGSADAASNSKKIVLFNQSLLSDKISLYGMKNYYSSIVLAGKYLALVRTASDTEIAESLNMTEDEYHRTVMKVSGTSILSLNDVWYAGDDNDNMSIGNNIESPSSLNPDVIAEREEIKKVIAQAISELPEKEKMVIVLYYHEDLTFKEIGEVLEVSESRISQLHTKANLRLRAKLTNLRKGII